MAPVDTGDRRTHSRVRRLHRQRRLTVLVYWSAWLLGGLVFVLLLAGGLAGLGAG